MQEGVDGICYDVIINEVADNVGELDKQVQQIDGIGDFEEKLAQVRSLKTHKSFKAIERFYNSMIAS